MYYVFDDYGNISIATYHNISSYQDVIMNLIIDIYFWKYPPPLSDNE